MPFVVDVGRAPHYCFAAMHKRIIQSNSRHLEERPFDAIESPKSARC